jgi:hypothetical protein
MFHRRLVYPVERIAKQNSHIGRYGCVNRRTNLVARQNGWILYVEVIRNPAGSSKSKRRTCSTTTTQRWNHHCQPMWSPKTYHLHRLSSQMCNRPWESSHQRKQCSRAVPIPVPKSTLSGSILWSCSLQMGSISNRIQLFGPAIQWISFSWFRNCQVSWSL